MTEQNQDLKREGNESNQNNQDRLALAVSIIFLVAVLLLGIRIFNTGVDYNFNLREKIATTTQRITNRFNFNPEENIIASSTKRDIELSDEDLAATFFTETEKATGVTTTNQDLVVESIEDRSANNSGDFLEQNERVTQQEQNQNNSQNQNANQASWTANDYKQGDIGEGNYTVKSGDTLWEIAEAVYGNGAEWVQILNANTDTIGFAPSGQQSMIYTGQTIVIPSLN